jgi:hydrogenase expression/formation protein HypE
MATERDFAVSCPVPLGGNDRVLLAHGGGGRLTKRLIETVFLPAFANPLLLTRHDGAVFALPPATDGAPKRLAFTTDGYVVRPPFFPGGDIGTLAVNGTVNDLAMCGARPLYLSAAFILEEGFSLQDLERIAASMQGAAREAGVALVTGDTKVVERGKADGIFVTTAGVGILEHSLAIGPAQVRPGDAIVLSGDIGRHGIAIMAAREDLRFETTISSDCAPLARPVLALLEAGLEVHCLRDLTRGGLAAALVEIAEASSTCLALDEDAIVVEGAVTAACEILGLDPLHVANEGRFVAFLPEACVDRALAVLRGERCEPRLVGRVVESQGPRVTLRTTLGPLGSWTFRAASCSRGSAERRCAHGLRGVAGLDPGAPCVLGAVSALRAPRPAAHPGGLRPRPVREAPRNLRGQARMRVVPASLRDAG